MIRMTRAGFRTLGSSGDQNDNQNPKKRVVLTDDFFNGDFLEHDRLSRAAAYNVALKAIDRLALISMIEGGIWQDPGFMPRISCIWTSLQDCNSPVEHGRKSNTDAANFIAQADMEIDTFILTINFVKSQ